MYLPSIGFIAVIVLVGQKLIARWKVTDQYSQLGKIFAISFIGLCIAVTFLLNYQWRSNYTVALELIRSYPGHFKGYSILGFEYYNNGKFQEAKSVLIKSLQLGDRDPRIYSMLHTPIDSSQSVYEIFVTPK